VESTGPQNENHYFSATKKIRAQCDEVPKNSYDYLLKKTEKKTLSSYQTLMRKNQSEQKVTVGISEKI